LQRTRVSFKIFAGGKLQAIHKNTCHDWIAMLPREFHQRQVAFMQITHGWHKRDAQLPTQLVTQFLDGMNNLQLFISVSRPRAN
jgi:hypothetical protein